MSVASTASIPAAFAAGLLSFLSPCVLPLVPAYLSYMSGVSVEELMEASHAEALKKTGLKSVLFVLGFSVVFIAMGATAASIGQFLAAQAILLMKVAGVIVIIFGLHMTGIFRIKALYSEHRFHSQLKTVSYAGSFLIGVMFAFGWTPCVGPVLAGILALAANSETVMRGVGLLAVYSLGLGLPFLIAGFATGTVLKALGRFRRHFRKIEVASGVLMILVGVVILTGNLGTISGLIERVIPMGG
jgi:cytochrome c-type biogenesis protein